MNLIIQGGRIYDSKNNVNGDVRDLLIEDGMIVDGFIGEAEKIIDASGKAVMAGLICYFPATVISTDGFSNVNRDAYAYLSSIGASQWRIFWSLRFPSAIPSMISALQVSVPLATIGAIVAELSGSSEGVGYLILRASYEFQTAMLFAVLILTSLFTVAIFKFVQFMGSKYARRYRLSYAIPID